jgi:hypothetical protein
MTLEEAMAKSSEALDEVEAYAPRVVSMPAITFALSPAI